MDLADEHPEIRAEARKLAAAIAPLAPEADESSVLHQGLYKIFADSRISEFAVPARWGGRLDTVDPLAFAIIREIFMGTSAHLDAVFAMQGIGSFAISVAGSDEQRATWLPRVARGEVLPALALTEPHAGSDLKNITTALTTDGDGLRLDGTKSYISNAGAAGYYLVFARDGDGFSLVLLERDTPGFTVETGPELFAPADIGTLRFDGVRLPVSAVVGDRGAAFDLVIATLGTFRVSMGAAALGVSQAVLDTAVRHATTREAFGRPLSRHGQVASLLADSWTDLEMARLLVYRAADRARRDPIDAIPHSSMAKLAATEAAARIVDRCGQVLGRFCLEKDSVLGRYYRHVRPMRIAEGASDVLRLGIARRLCEDHANTEGATP